MGYIAALIFCTSFLVRQDWKLSLDVCRALKLLSCPGGIIEQSPWPVQPLNPVR